MVQCKGKNKNGLRCKHQCNANDKHCFQHKKTREKSPKRINTKRRKSPLAHHQSLLSMLPKFKPIDKNGRYNIIENGGIAFQVNVQFPMVEIYKYNEENPFLTFNALKVFVGVSPKTKMTELSGGYGSKWHGNSILLQTKGLNYIYIGTEIYSFTALHPIVYYISEVGNSAVPYPYAVDDHDNMYMMIERKMFNGNSKDFSEDDPYRYYYKYIQKSAKPIPNIHSIQKRIF
ncbi:MAG TPA: hypothetical protein VLG50_05445 [Candidatus Saccharimonadales bacterium]|nr:hypothetical protein [Candidatus Saccharimonadales bacterium]